MLGHMHVSLKIVQDTENYLLAIRRLNIHLREIICSSPILCTAAENAIQIVVINAVIVWKSVGIM